MNLEKVVRELADKKDIEDLITWRFARAIDWLDVESAKACFTRTRASPTTPST